MLLELAVKPWSTLVNFSHISLDTVAHFHGKIGESIELLTTNKETQQWERQN